MFPIVGSKEKFQRDLIFFHRAVEFIKFFVNFSRSRKDLSVQKGDINHLFHGELITYIFELYYLNIFIFY